MMTSHAPPAAPVLRALSTGEILDASFTVYRKHFGPLAIIVLVCSVVPFALGAYLMAAGAVWANLPLFFVYLIAMVALGSVATGATVFVVSESYLGRAITADEAFRRAAPRFGQIIGSSILLGFMVLVGMLALFVPGIILGCGLALAIPAVVLEPQLTASGALSRSWTLTQGYKWRLFALLGTSLVLVYIPAAAIEGVAALFIGEADRSVAWFAPVASSLAQMFLYPFFYCVLTTTYYDLRVRKEGFDLELLASSLQPA